MAFTTKDRDNDKSGGDITAVTTPTSTVTMEKRLPVKLGRRRKPDETWDGNLR